MEVESSQRKTNQREASKKTGRSLSMDEPRFAMLLVAEGFDGIELGGAVGGIKAEADADRRADN